LNAVKNEKRLIFAETFSFFRLLERNLTYLYSLYFSLKLSAIIAINSELVGFPLLF